MKKKSVTCSCCGKELDRSYDSYSIRVVKNKDVVSCIDCDVDFHVPQKSKEE